jgi:hypothetical protein
MAKTVLLVGAETHTGFMPWTPENYRYMYGQSSTPPTPEEYEGIRASRNVTVLFETLSAVLRPKRRHERSSIASCVPTEAT